MIQNSKVKFITNYDVFLCNFSLFFYVMMILEVIPIFISLIESTMFSNSNMEDYLEMINYLKYVSPYYYVKSSLTCVTQGKTICQVSLIDYAIATLLPYVLALILILTYSSYPFNKNKNNKIFHATFYFLTNFWEFIMNVLGIVIIFVMTNQILMTINSLTSGDTIGNYILISGYILNLIIFLIIAKLHLKTNNLILTFDNNKISYKDNLFSPIYNNFLFALKILICFRDNFSLLNQNVFKTSLSIIIIFLILIFNLKLISDSLSKKIIFLTNFKFNIMRVTLIYFIFFETVYKFFFRKHLNLNYVSIPNFIICLVFSLISVNSAKTRIIESSDKINQLALIVLQLLAKKDPEEVKRLIRKIEWNNSLSSDNEKRSTVYPECNELDFCYDLIADINSEIKEDYSKTQFNASQKIFLQLCCLIIYRQDPSKKNKFIFAIKKELNKNYEMLNDFEYNCISLYQNTDFGEEFYKISEINKIIETYNKSNDIIQKSITNYNRILENSSVTFNDTFYTLVSSLAQIKIDLKENITFMLDKKTLFIDNFNFFTINYTFEYLFKEKISEVENFLSEEEIREVMKHHYKFDNILCLSYYLKTGDIQILNYSKDFSSSKGNNFELLFPVSMRVHLKNEFIKLLETEFKSSCDFFYFNPTTLTTKKFNFNFVTYQNLTSDIIYILGSYTISDDNLLITRAVGKKENIENISLRWVNLIGLDPSIADFFKRKHINADMNDFFTQRKCLITEKSISKEKTFYQVNEVALSTMKCKKFISNFDFPEVYLKPVFQYTDDEVTNRIYSVHAIDRLIKKRGADENESLNDSHVSAKNFHFAEEKTSDSMTSISHHFNEPKANKEQKKLDNKSINKLAISTLLYNVLLIIYCIVFLAVGYKNINDLKNFYAFRSSFNNMKYFWFHTYLSLYQNILLFKEGTEDISNYSLPGADYFAQFLLYPDIKINVAEYCVDEMAFKLDILKNKISNFQVVLSSFSATNSYALDTDFDEHINFYSMRNTENIISLQTTSYKIFDALSMLLNKAYTSFEPNTSFTSLWIISFNDGVYDFSNIVNTNLNAAQSSVYEICFNYETLLRFFTKMSTKIDGLFHDNMIQVSNSNTTFSFILVVLHLFYLLLCGHILSVFNYFIGKYNLVITIFLTEENIASLIKKLNNLHNLNQLYSKNPMKCLGEIEKQMKNENENDKVIILKNKFQLDAEKLIEDLNEIGDGKEKDETMKQFSYIRSLNVITKTNLVLPYIKVLAIIFLLYFCFFIITYYFFITIFNNFVEVNKYSTDFINTQNRGINNALLTQTIFQNNQTDYQLNKFMNGDDSTGYLRQGFTESYETLKSLHIQDNLSIMAQIKKEVNTLDCITIYKSTDQMYKNFEASLINSLVATCRTYQYMDQGNIYTLQNELIYLQQYLLNFYEETGNDYTKMKHVWDEFKFFDQLVINNIISRPIVDNLYNTLIYSTLISCINNFNIYSMFYLISNMLVDILILILINKFIITKIQKQDREIKEFILWA